MKKKNKFLFISSSQLFADMFLKDVIIKLSVKNKIFLITDVQKRSDYFNNLTFYDIPIKRKIALISDTIAAIRILAKTICLKPDRIITVTPKTIIFGILIKLFLMNIYRIHIYTGFTWSNMKGIKKRLFILLDKINVYFSDRILFDSQNQIDFLKDHKFNFSKFNLINHGSIKGVNTNIFYKFNNSLKIKLRKNYKIDNNKFVILYMGRMSPEKGILKLIECFKNLNRLNKDIILLLVGTDEMNIRLHLNNVEANIKKNIIYLGHSNKPQEILNLSNIFCLPSTREGFGNSLIEASSCEIPVIGSDIFGLRSSLINNLNGLTFRVNDICDLTYKINKLINDKNLCEYIGKKGRDFVVKNFEKEKVLSSLAKLLTK